MRNSAGMMAIRVIGAIALFSLVGCFTFTLQDLRANSIHTSKSVAGDYAVLGTCLSRWLDENAAGGRVPRDFPDERLYQIQGLRKSSVGGFQTLVELRQASDGLVLVDTYVAHDLIRFSSESITERFFRGLGTCL